MHELPPDAGEHAIDPPELASAPDNDPAPQTVAEPASVAVQSQALEAAEPASSAETVAADALVATVAPKPELSPAACAARLAELFPALFGPGPRRPLKLRIQADIQQRATGEFTKKTLSAFLHRYTTTTAYLIAMTQASTRFDLDGQTAGELSDEHRQAAVTELARRRGLHEERRAAEQSARRAEHAQAQAQARQQRAAQDTARQERAVLLRAFEATTLTPANFCALKGIALPELEARLAVAREERTQWQQSRPPAEPHAQHGPQGQGPQSPRRPLDARPRGPGPGARPGDDRRRNEPRGERQPASAHPQPRGRGRPGGTGRP